MWRRSLACSLLATNALCALYRSACCCYRSRELRTMWATRLCMCGCDGTDGVREWCTKARAFQFAYGWTRINLSRGSFDRDCCVHQHSMCFILRWIGIVDFFTFVLFNGSTHSTGAPSNSIHAKCESTEFSCICSEWWDMENGIFGHRSLIGKMTVDSILSRMKIHFDKNKGLLIH